MPQVHDPEILRPNDRLPAPRDLFAEKIAWAMDGMFKVGPWTVGLDGILGLIPGLGDILGALIGMLIVLRAAQAGVPRIAIARMVTNIAIDTLIGALPILGDAFDFAYKSNTKNLRIYEDALRRDRRSQARHWGFFILLLLGLGIVVAAILYGFVALMHRLAVGLHF